MANVLWLAKFIMSRLKYNYKFMLISVLFMCPIALLSVQLWNQLESDIHTTELEAEGVRIIKELNSIASAAENLRDLQMAHNYDRSEAHNSRVFREKNAVDAAVADFIKQHRTSNLIRPAQIERLENALTKAKNEELGSQIMIREYINAYGTLVTELHALVMEVAKTSNLSNDTDPDLNQDMGLYLDKLRPLQMSLGKLRGYGNNTLNTTYLDSASFTEVDAAYFHTRSEYTEFTQAFEKLKKEHPDTPWINPVESTRGAIEQLLFLFNDQVVEGLSEKMPWNQYHEKMTAPLDQVRQLETLLLDHANEAVTTRLQTKQQNRAFLIISLLVLLGVIGYLYLGLYASLRSSINKLVIATSKVANGDMTVHVRNESHDEFSTLVGNFNNMTDQMNQLIKAARNSSDTTSGHAQGVKQLAQQNSEIVQQQTDETRRIHHAMEEMSAAAEDVARETEFTANAAQDADEHARQGQQLVGSAVNSFSHLTDNINSSMRVVERLAEQSKGVTEILSVIKSIAQQTNLLALNAAIEAARAGEQGRGFAVVADEVRSLAQRSHESTVEIDDVLGKIQLGVEEAVAAMQISVSVTAQSVTTARELTGKLEDIMQGVTNINDRAQSISAATLEQTESVNHVRSSVQAIDARAGDAAQAAKETVSSAEQMQQSIEELVQLLSRFNV